MHIMPSVVFSKYYIYDNMEVGMHENDAINHNKTSFFNIMIIYN